MQNPQFVIRAMPAMGFSHRWCAQRPWGKEHVTVSIVDESKPPAIGPNGDPLPRYATVDAQKNVRYEYGNEITSADLEELRADPHISVSIAGSADGDPLELNTAKASMLEASRKFEQARKEHQAEVEELKAFRAGAIKQAEEAGLRAAKLEQELASAQAQLAERGKKK